LRTRLSRARAASRRTLPLCHFYVKRAGAAAFARVAVPAAADVAALVDAAVAKLRLDAPPDAVTLALETGGPPLDARLALSDAFDARALALHPSLLVTVAARADRESDASPPSLLPYRVLDPLVDAEPQPVSSDADFDAFIRGRTLWAVRDKGEGRSARTMVTNLAAARRALTTAGTYLLLRVAGDALEVDVSNLKRASKNESSFEQLANKAVAADAGLRARYGELVPVNNGEEVVFIDTRTGKDYASYDGLFLCADGVLFNESKAHLTPADVEAVDDAHARLSAVVADPARFKSRPEYVPLAIERGKGRAVIPLLSSSACDAATAAAAAAARVHVLVQSGEGFACAVAAEEFGPARAPQKNARATMRP